MGRIKDGIETAKSTGDISRLKAAVKNAPKRGIKSNPFSNDNDGPIHHDESFDDVTAAWTRGDLNDAQYEELLHHAGGVKTPE